MSKVAHYLQEHLVGEVIVSTDARRYFATDASILQVAPSVVVYPRGENDVRKTARFAWQLAERGRVIPLTARGLGSDTTGAALSSGLMVVFPAHMNRLLELNTKSNDVVVEAGANFGKLQQALHTHGRFLPPYPNSADYITVGGALANNASGEKSLKYGDMRSFAKSLRVVLANGEVIVTGRLSKRELNKKLGLATFEGEIYRSLDTLLEENRAAIEKVGHKVAKNNTGYLLDGIKHKDGSIDITPLMVGSQGTLGIITEATLDIEAYNPQTTLIVATFDDLQKAQDAILDLREMSDIPSAIELVDGNLLQQVQELNPHLLKDVMKPPFPAIVLVVEFDNGDRQIKKARKRAQKIIDKYATSSQTATDPEEQQKLWKVRQTSSIFMAHNEGLLRALPIVDDAIVPVQRLREHLEGIYALFKEHNLPVAVWGHAGEGIIHVQPKLNIGQVGDRQKAFRLMNEYFKLVHSLGGVTGADSGDGRLHAPYLEAQVGAEMYGILQKVKKIFDPYDILNPGVKFGTSMDDLKSMVRQDYGHDHRYDYLPRS